MIQLLFKKYPLLPAIIKKIHQNNGHAFLVGGAVRDHLLNHPVKDIDIEVHNITTEQLEAILQKYGTVNTIGKSFGILRIASLNIDWSLPRTDSIGRKPVVTIDPSLSIEESSRRRDLTMNALAINMSTNELIDPFNGIQDIKQKILRAPDAKLFAQDPLRLLRVMQFIGRFEMTPDAQLNTICSTIDLSTISRERIEEEFNKLLLLSQRPSLGIRWLFKINRLKDILPELSNTIGIPQNPHYHPEGDVFEHSMQALDAAATIAASYNCEFNKRILLYAALCHDLGKTTTTTHSNNNIKSIGHEKESKKYTLTMMRRITHNTALISSVASLVEHHMAPLQFIKNNAKLPAYKRLACKLVPTVSINMLADLSLADKQGRNDNGHSPLAESNADVALFIKQSTIAGILHKAEPPIVTGADLLTVITPGPQMGRVLAMLYDIQINEGITDKAVLIKRIRAK